MISWLTCGCWSSCSRSAAMSRRHPVSRFRVATMMLRSSWVSAALVTRSARRDVGRRLGLGGGLPELESVTLWVNSPAEAAIFGFHDLLGGRGAGRAELGEHRVEVADAE